MATARKLPSGSYRCQIYDYTDEKGKRHYKSFTAKTKKEAEYLATTYKIDNNSNNQSNLNIILKEAMQNYCSMKSNVLSPTTLVNYKRLINNAYENYLSLPINKFSAELIQKWVNEYSIGRSPKTVRNAYGFLYVVLKACTPNLHIAITLPQKIKPRLYVPTDDNIKAILNYYKENDRDMLVAVYLAAFGTLRRSEVCALTAVDIDGNTLHINKALVYSDKADWAVKTTKTTSSTRDIDMPDYIIKELPISGRLVNLNPNQITHRFAKTLKTLNIQSFRFHDLRHYAASMMHALGVPDVYIMQRGGWSSDATLKNIYRGVMNDYKEKFTNKVFEHLENMQHEISHKK
jgi:integrase family protein